MPGTWKWKPGTEVDVDDKAGRPAGAFWCLGSEASERSGGRMGSSSTQAAAAAAAPSRRRVALYLTLLTLQYGAQPLISKRFVR